MAEEKQVKRNAIKAYKELGEYMADHFYEMDNAVKTGEKKIAWCTSVGPAELLRAMGFLVYFPENHGSMLGSTRTENSNMATELIPYANAIGYSPEVCSYTTSDIGAFIKKMTPLSQKFKGITSVPRPDVLVFNTNQCRDVQDWFAWYSRELNVPIVGVNGYTGVKTVTEPLVTAIAKQMEALVEPLEKISREKFDIDKLRESVDLSRKCSDLWSDVLDTAAAKPSPITFTDSLTLMGPAVVGRGTQGANVFYKILLDELRERIKNKEGAIENEKYRLYWDGMPVWGRLSAHFKLFAGLNTNIVASTYCSSWVFKDLDGSDPFRSMAKAYTELFNPRSDEYKEEYIIRVIKSHSVDGLIFHDAKTCPYNTNCRYGMAKRLEEKTGLPSLTINGDLNDLRMLSDEQTKTNVEAFIEQIAESK